MARYSKSIVRDMRARRSCQPTSFAKIFFASATGTLAVGAWILYWNQRRALAGKTAVPAMLPVMPLPQSPPQTQMPGQRSLPKFPALTVEV